jgi:hypothetical protein
MVPGASAVCAGLSLHQAALAVVGECAPIFDLVQGLGKLGAQAVTLGLGLSKPRPPKVAFGSQGGQLVVPAHGAPAIEALHSRHGRSLAVQQVEMAASSVATATYVPVDEVVEQGWCNPTYP